MTEPGRCPRCGADLPADAPADLCPACLLRQAMGGDPAGRRGMPPAATPADLAGLFPQLEILDLLGRGGMGVVYKARQPKLDRLVALKVLPAEIGRDPAFAERFVREARALARLDHPGIVAVHDFGESGGLFFLVMQFVDGANLRQVLQEGRLTPEEALRLVPQICEALQYAHEQGVVHRDIKPENILLDRRGRVKIADFGLAKLVGHGPAGWPLTGSGQVMGTPHYMAPEQTERPREVDHRADIYSLGVVFYEMLTGELPLGRFPLPSSKAGVDARLDGVVLRALEKEPGRRYQHADEVKTEVESISAGQPPLGGWGPTGAPAGEDPTEVVGRPPGGLPRGFRWKLPALVAATYGLAFALPAYRYSISWDHGPSDRGYVAMNENQRGWECFRLAWDMQYTCWYANPVFWAACTLFLLRRWLWTGVAALVAVVLALQVWDPFSQSRYLVGYWAWVGSMAGLAGGGLYGWWRQRKAGGPVANEARGPRR